MTPLDAPGISIRPILSISGEHEVNQVFFDGVRIPVGNRLGEENRGWDVAKYLLEFERGGGVIGIHEKVAAAKVKAIAARETSDSGGSLLEDAAFRVKTASLDIEIMAAELTGRRLSGGASAADASVGGIAASIKKMLSSQRSQDVSALTMEAIGQYAQVDQRPSLAPAYEAAPVGPEYAATPTAKSLNGRRPAGGGCTDSGGALRQGVRQSKR
jgi:alkylation response protein AidB-like acyl-CoA dehydrogenase